MKRVVPILLVLSFCLLALAGCGGKSAGAKTLDLEAFADEVAQSVEYDDELIALTQNNVAHYYKLPESGVNAWKILVSATSGTTNELAVFECADAKALGDVKAAVEKRLETQRANYENYIPAEIARIDDALIKTSGNYLLFSVSDHNDAVEKLFDAALK